MSKVVIVDYGIGNIKSVQRGLEKVGAGVKLSSDPKEIAAADHLVLPGVGAFEDGMKGLSGAGVIDAIKKFAQTGRPLLGICLGMQMLMERSEENGSHSGLGLIPGVVKLIPKETEGMHARKIPHIGWNGIHYNTGCDEQQRSVLQSTPDGECFYFVHSYMAVPNDTQNLLAYCEYEGLKIPAAVNKDNIVGLQFHPEKSAGAGLAVLAEFMRT